VYDQDLLKVNDEDMRFIEGEWWWLLKMKIEIIEDEDWDYWRWMIKIFYKIYWRWMILIIEDE
jgi:hypothetical protein